MLLAIESTLKGLWRAITSPRSVFFLYLPNLALAACVAAPLYVLFNEHLATSPQAREAFSAYDGPFLSDFLRVHGDHRGALTIAAAVAAIAWYACWLFIEGGAIAAASESGRKLTLTGFFAACGRNFFAFVRGLVPAAIAAFVLAIANRECSRLLTHYFEETRAGAAGEFELGTILVGKTVLFLVFFLLFVSIPTSLARVRAVVDDDRSMLRGYFAGLALCLRKPFSLLLLFAINGVAMLAVFIAVDEFSRRVPLDHDLHPFASFATNDAKWIDVAIPPIGLHITVWQAALWVLLLLLVARCAALVAFWRATTSPQTTRDPELVYARGPVVDAPPTRRRNAGYAFADDNSVSGG